MSKKISEKTHSKEQLDNWANQNNPNNKAYKANNNNHSNQLNSKRKTHQQIHNSNRHNKHYQPSSEWPPDLLNMTIKRIAKERLLSKTPSVN